MGPFKGRTIGRPQAEQHREAGCGRARATTAVSRDAKQPDTPHDERVGSLAAELRWSPPLLTWDDTSDIVARDLAPWAQPPG
jgi:hypothetical protein